MELQFKIDKITLNDYKLTASKENIEVGSIYFEILKNPFTHAMHEFVRKSILKENLQLTNYIFLHDFYVEHNYRKNKIGSRLLKGIIQIVAIRFKEYKIMLDAHPYSDDNNNNNIALEDLIHFYEKFGFTYIEGFGNNIMIR